MNNKIKLNLPTFKFKFKDDKYIFDEFRKKYIVLTPEEWVRQNILKYLNEKLEYPKHLLGVEKQIDVLGTIKRPDIIVFDNKLEPKMIVECKNTEVKINQQTLNQAVDYFIKLKTEYFLLTNGIRHYCCKIKNNKCSFLSEIPEFSKL